jgi:hypothetical protein
MQFHHNWRIIVVDFLVNDEIKRRGIGMKKLSNMDRARSFEKDTLWSSNLKNYTNYTISVPRYFPIHFLYKSLFLLSFNSLLREEKKEVSRFRVTPI